jgi:hypothetical protein
MPGELSLHKYTVINNASGWLTIDRNCPPGWHERVALDSLGSILPSWHLPGDGHERAERRERLVQRKHITSFAFVVLDPLHLTEPVK